MVLLVKQAKDNSNHVVPRLWPIGSVLSLGCLGPFDTNGAAAQNTRWQDRVAFM